MKIGKDGRVRIKVTIAPGVQKVWTPYPHEVEQAKLAAKALYQEAVNRLTPSSPLERIATALWLPRTARLRNATQKRYKAAYLHIHAFMGGQAIDAIKPEHVQAFVNHLERKLVSRSGKGSQLAPMSPAGVRFVYQILFQILDLAYHAQLIARNPCSRLVTRPPAPRRRQRKMPVLQAFEHIHAAPDPLKFPLFCGLILGLRLGEIAGLEWDDLDRPNAVLWIQRQVTHQGEVEPLKTEGSYRPIPLTPDMIAFIDSYANLETQRMSPLTRRQITYRYNRWPDRPAGWTFHDTRHGAAAIILAASGNDVLAAKELLGHSKLETTMLYIADDADRIRAGFGALPTVLPTVSRETRTYGGE